MAIQSNRSDAPTEGMGYPKLMEYKDKNFIVLFTTESKGTVVWAGSNSPHPVGFHIVSWLINTFKEYEGSVVLSNKK